jgi:molecular chaperone DnaK (HSP70)
LSFPAKASNFCVKGESGIMARGWESKAVEDQIEQANERARRSLQSPEDLSPEERERRERLESLMLSRTRTLAQLESATRPAHRQMLQRTLRALEAEIEEQEAEVRRQKSEAD